MIQVETTLTPQEAYVRMKHLIAIDGGKILKADEPVSILAQQGAISSLKLRDTPKEMLVSFTSSVMGSKITIKSNVLPKVDLIFIALAVAILSMNTILNILSILFFSVISPTVQRAVISTSLLGIGFFLMALIQLTFTHLRIDGYAQGLVKDLSPWLI